CEEKEARRIILETAIQHLEKQRAGHTAAGKRTHLKSKKDVDADSRASSEDEALQDAARDLSDDLVEAYEDLSMHYRRRLAAVTHHGKSSHDDPAGDLTRAVALSRQLVRLERDTAIRLRNEGRINDEVLRQIERELDLTETHLDTKLHH